MVTVIRAAQIEAEPLVLALRNAAAPELSMPLAAASLEAVGTPDETVAAEGQPAPEVISTELGVAMEEAIPSAPDEDLARELAQQEREQALQQAYEDGFQAGVADVQTRFAQDLNSIASLLEELRGALERDIDGLENVAIEIAYEAVGRMLGEQMRERAATIAIVRRIVRETHAREQLLVRVAPDDYDMLNRARASLGQSDLAGVELVADERVALGGCLVETSGGSLDARLETQFQRLREVLLRAREQHAEEV